MTFHSDYNAQFLATPDSDGAAKYGVTVAAAAASAGQTCYRCIGIAHLTGPENAGNHHVYLDVLDEQGQRIDGARLMVSNSGKAPYPVMIDKPAEEAGANVPMYWNDTLSIWVGGDFPTDKAQGFHVRHEDEEPGTTRGHHSFYAAFQRTKAGTVPPPVEPPVEEPGPVEDWRKSFDERQLKEIDYCLLYDTPEFRHGTDGHNIRLIVAKMVRLLDAHPSRP